MEVPTPLRLLFSSHRRDMETELFLSILWVEAKRYHDPMAFLMNFPVPVMRFKKTVDVPSEHEYLHFEVAMTDNVRDASYQFILERTASTISTDPNTTTVDEFLNHPESKNLLDTILEGIRSSPSALAAAVAVAATVPVLGPASIVAAAPFVITYSEAFRPLSLINDDPPSSYFPPSSFAPDYSYAEHASMKMAEIIQTISDSPVGLYTSKSLNKDKPRPDTLADDMFVGVSKLSSAQYASGVEVGQFRPQHLTLFHLALLAHIVHIDYPLYALFKSQCYWYAGTVFYAAQIIDHDLAQRSSDCPSPNFSFVEDKFFFPFSLYKVEKAGCWKGIRISGPSKYLLSRIVKKFHEQLHDYNTKARKIEAEASEIGRKLDKLTKIEEMAASSSQL